MADAVKALAFVVCIGPVGVGIPGVAATKMDVGVTLPPPPTHTHRRWPNSPTMTIMEDQQNDS